MCSIVCLSCPLPDQKHIPPEVLVEVKMTWGLSGGRRREEIHENSIEFGFMEGKREEKWVGGGGFAIATLTRLDNYPIVGFLLLTCKKCKILYQTPLFTNLTF